MADFLSLPRFDTPPFRNRLHDFNSYNYTIVLRVFEPDAFSDQNLKDGYPAAWDSFEAKDKPDSFVLAATGGTYGYPNRWGEKDQLSDTLIENLKLEYPVGTSSFRGQYAMAYTLTIREPNGIDFMTSIAAAYNYFIALRTDTDSRLSEFNQMALLISVYFNLNPTSVDRSSKQELNTLKIVKHIPVALLKTEFKLTESGTIYTLSGTAYASFMHTVKSTTGIMKGGNYLEGRDVGSFVDAYIKILNDIEKAKNQGQNKDDKPEVEYDYAFVGTFADLYKNSPIMGNANGENIQNSPMKSLADLTQELRDRNSVTGAGKVSTSQINNDLDRAVQELGASTQNGKYDAIPKSYLEKLAGVETGGTFDNTIRNSVGSSATGLFQFVSGTWTDITKRAGEIPEFKQYQSVLQTKGPTDPYASAIGAIILAKISASQYRAASTGNDKTRPLSESDRYLLHMLGASGGTRFINSPDSKVVFKPNAVSTVDALYTAGDPVIQQNFPIFANNDGTSRTVGETKKYIEGRLNSHAGQLVKVASTPTRDQRDVAAAVATSTSNSPNVNSTVAPIVTIEGMSFNNFVEMLAVNSAYCAGEIKKFDINSNPNGGMSTGFFPFVKVVPTVDFLGEYDQVKNVLRKKVTFNIIGINIAPNISTNVAAFNEIRANTVKNATIRAYNYLFTGKNIDITNLDLSFNNTFYQSYPAFRDNKQASQLADNASTTVTSNAQPAVSQTSPDQGNSVSGSGPVILNQSTNPGFPKDYSETYSIMKTLMPQLFGRGLQVDFGILNMEIVGDPDLIPDSESILTTAMFQDRFKKWEQDQKEADITKRTYVFPTSWGPTYFLLNVGNPAVNKRSEGLASGYYMYNAIVANFKDSGGFTMNVEGVKFPLMIRVGGGQPAQIPTNPYNQGGG